MAMPTRPPIFAGLEGLLDLAHTGGIDIRTTLLRVLTDLYVQKRAQSADEERHYVELALRLIEEVDVSARTAVAHKLAVYPMAPRSVVLRLARDVPQVAEPLLRYSSALTPADLARISIDCGEAHAAIIVARGGHREPSLSVTVGCNDAGSPAAELCELFFAASGAERRLILTNLDYIASAASEPVGKRADSTVTQRLETAALQHNADAFARELVHALQLSERQARRIVTDELGEPLVVVAKALSVPTDVFQRILLFVNPMVGQSVERVYELSALYAEITQPAANHLVAIWRETDPPDNRTVRPPSGKRRGSEEPRQSQSERPIRAPTTWMPRRRISTSER
jgi:uncharacterized protein (DUF2336 family)